MFPGPGAQIIRNEAGEVIGWDYPSNDLNDLWCDLCGFAHGGDCPLENYEDEEEDDGDM